MALKVLLVFLGLLAIAVGFSLPEDQRGLQQKEPSPVNGVLVRMARSPQRKFEANVMHQPRFGTSASLGYTHPLGRNFEAYGQVSRNFKFNDRSGLVGFRYRF